jgi:hypothetical protein
MTNFAFSKIKVEHLYNALEELVMIKSILRNYAPDYLIESDQEKNEIIKTLKKTAKYLLPLYEELGLCQESTPELPDLDSKKNLNKSNYSNNQNSSQIIDSNVKLLEIIQQDYIFVSSNTIKKKLKLLGIDSNKIIVAGGPINLDDLKIINPNIPTAVLQGYQKKIDGVYEELKNAFRSGKKIYFAVGVQEDSDKILINRVTEIEQKVQGKLNILYIKNWEKL